MRLIRRWWRKLRYWLTGERGRKLTATFTFESAEDLLEIHGFHKESLINQMTLAIREQLDEDITNAMLFGQAWRETMPNYRK